MTRALAQVLGGRGIDATLASGGAELQMACPLCGDDKQRLYINQRTGMWICHRCEAKGGILSFLERVCGMDPMASYHTAQQLGGARQLQQGQRAEATPPPTLELPDVCMPLDDWNDPMQKMFWNYLLGRGIDPEAVKEFNMGYCVSGPYAYRVVIPVYMGGSLKGWVARAIIKSESPNEPKVKNAPNMESGKVLFNFDRVNPPHVILTEGIFDALVRPWDAMATFGARVTDYQREILWARGFREVTLAYDGDKAGWHGALEAAPTLAGRGFVVKVAKFAAGVDPASCLDLTSTLANARLFDLESPRELRRWLTTE